MRVEDTPYCRARAARGYPTSQSTIISARLSQTGLLALRGFVESGTRPIREP